MSNANYILAVDTSSPVAGIAISSDDKILSSLTVNTGRPHSLVLFPIISLLCKLTDIELEEIDLFAAVTGPGSFTGLRVGLAALKGLADSLGKPVLGRTAFDLLALGSGRIGLHLIAIRAGRGEFFCGLREVKESGNVDSILDDSVCSPSSIEGRYAGPSQTRNLTLIIDGECEIKELDELQKRWGLAPHQMIWSRRDRIHLADALAVSAIGMLKSGLLPSLTPYYIRPSDAEFKKTA